MDCVIPCLGREQQTQQSCHHARMHVTNTASVPTAWRHHHQCHPFMVMDELLVYWMDSPGAPWAVFECVSCKCKKCTGARCSCKLNWLRCTGACHCDADNCENRCTTVIVTLTDMDYCQKTTPIWSDIWSMKQWVSL